MMIFITPDTLPRDGFIQPVVDAQWVSNILGKAPATFSLSHAGKNSEGWMNACFVWR